MSSISSSSFNVDAQPQALPIEPRTYHQAINNEHKAKWQQAMNEELESLIKNNTWTFETLPIGRTMWIFCVKFKGDGTIA